MMDFLKIIALIFLIGFCSCNKEKKRKKLPGTYFGNSIATKNNAKWASDYIRTTADTSCYKGKLGIEFLKANDKGFLRESLILLNISPKKGSYKIYPSSNYINPCIDTFAKGLYVTSLDDGDVQGDVYNVLPTENSNITITDYNITTKEISGTFQVSFIITVKFNPSAPDTLRFKGGVFYTKILD